MKAEEAIERIRQFLHDPDDPEREVSGADFIDYVSEVLAEYAEPSPPDDGGPGGVMEIPEGYFMLPVVTAPNDLRDCLRAIPEERRPDHVIMRTGRHVYPIQVTLTPDDVALHVDEETAERAYREIK